MIIHLDLDCFFVSAERTRVDSFRGVPAVVANRSDNAIFGDRALKTNIEVKDGRGAFSGDCFYNKFGGDWTEHFLENGKVRGMVVAASYEARSHGIKTGTTLSEALRLCPHLRIRPTDMPFYMTLSRALSDYLDMQIPVIEQYSIDEFFGSVDGYIKDGDLEQFLRGLQAEIYKRFSLPITIGAGANRTIAKLAAKSVKPFGVKVVWRSEVQEFLNDKPIRAVAGIGRKIGATLEKYGHKTIGDLLRSPAALTSFGKVGADLLRELRGEEQSEIKMRDNRKQIGISRTFDPILDRREIRRRIAILCGHLAFSVTRHQKEPRSFTFSIGYSNGVWNQVKINADRIFCERLLLDCAKEAFETLDSERACEAMYLGVSAGDFKTNGKTPNMLDWEKDAKNRKLNDALFKVRSKYGYSKLAPQTRAEI